MSEPKRLRQAWRDAVDRFDLHRITPAGHDNEGNWYPFACLCGWGQHHHEDEMDFREHRAQVLAKIVADLARYDRAGTTLGTAALDVEHTPCPRCAHMRLYHDWWGCSKCESCTTIAGQIAEWPEEEIDTSVPRDSCTEEVRSAGYFGYRDDLPEWLRCDLLPPHDVHENQQTGITWTDES